MIKHKTYSEPIGDTGDYYVWTACGLGEKPNPFAPSGREGYEFEAAITDDEVSCNSCIRCMAAKPQKWRLDRDMTETGCN